MGKRLGILLAASGVALAAYSLREEAGSNLQMVGAAGGFILFAAGLGTLFDMRGLESVRDHPEESDTPARVRLLGAAVVLGSLLLPYAYTPLEAGAQRTGYSFVGLIRALYSGVQVADGFMILALMSVVVIGGFIALLHHFGGYLILLGTAGFGYFVMDTMGIEATQVIVSEFQIGVYVAIVGSLIIISSSLMTYDVAETDKGVYGSGR
ncbi:MAG: hypothetical protein U5J64_02975 [Halobacteriales archaeon]|nr:hypothetical protein [Halobacteriales archaeon]